MKHLRCTLCVALNQAINDDLIQRNAAKKVKPPEVLPRALDAYTPAEARMLIEVARGHRLEALFTDADADAKEPEAAKKVLLDNYASKGVMPSDLEKWLEHPIGTLVPAELRALRKIYVAFSNAEVTRAEVMAAKFGTEDTEEQPEAKEKREKLRDRILKSEPSLPLE